MSFQQFHPLTIIFYYGSLLIMATLTKQPVIIGLVLVAALVHHLMTAGGRSTWRTIIYDLFVMLLVLMMSVAFKHNGVTPLFFWNDQAVTKEVIVWAICVGLLLMLLHLLYENVLRHLTTDRLLFACRLLWPALSMGLSMLLRFIPTVQQRFHQMHQAQKTIGYYATASLFDKGSGLLKTAYESTVWAFDQCFHKSDTMRARGYHLQRKTVFHLYKWRMEDSLIVAILGIAMALFLMNFKELAFYYFPDTKAMTIPVQTITSIVIVSWLPVLIDLKERLKWLYYSSKM